MPVKTGMAAPFAPSAPEVRRKTMADVPGTAEDRLPSAAGLSISGK